MSDVPETVEWAVLPVAGRGTRMYPAAAAAPKALLPVGMLPMLQWTLQEVIDAEIPGAIVVLGPEQTAIRAFVESARREGVRRPESELGRFGRALARIDLRWVEQPRPRGVGDAFIRCRDLTGDDPFAVLLPDNWFEARPPAIRQVLQTFRLTGLDTIGLTAVEAAEAWLYGNVGRVRLEEIEGPSRRILRLQDKGEGTFRPPQGETTLRGCARYVCTPRFYDALRATGPPATGEWDDVPAFQRLIRGAGLAGHVIDGRHFDVGRPSGYLAAAHWLHEQRRRRRDSGGDQA